MLKTTGSFGVSFIRNLNDIVSTHKISNSEAAALSTLKKFQKHRNTADSPFGLCYAFDSSA